MISQFSKFFSLALVLALGLAIYQTEAKCDTCGSNGIACINETSFNICYDTKPNKDQVITCSDGQICVRSSLRCAPPNMGLSPDCPVGVACGKCDGSKLFTCTSRTTFAMCNGEQLTETKGSCPAPLVCDSSSAEICVTECKLTGPIECDKDAP